MINLIILPELHWSVLLDKNDDSKIISHEALVGGQLTEIIHLKTKRFRIIKQEDGVPFHSYKAFVVRFKPHGEDTIVFSPNLRDLFTEIERLLSDDHEKH